MLPRGQFDITRVAKASYFPGGHSSILTGWPPEGAAAEQVQVDVKHGLPGFGIAVDEGTVTPFGDAFLGRNIFRGQRQFSQ